MVRRLAAVGLLLALSAVAQQENIDKAFAEYVRTWNDADKDGLARLLSDDLVWITRGGKVMNKQEYIQVFNPKTAMANLREKTIRIVGDFAVMTYAAEEGSTPIRRTIIWNKTRDGWKVISAQATSIQ